MKRLVLVSCLVTVLSALAFAAELPHRSEVIFSAPFNGSAEPAIARNPKRYYADELRYSYGMSGLSAVPQGRGYCRYSAEGNINLSQGTLTMWVRPINWVGAEAGALFLFSLEGKGRMVLGKPTGAGRDLFFIVRGADGPEARVDFDIDSWQPGRWHHVAATWTPGKIALYCDGELAGRAEYEGGPPADVEHFTVGRTQWSKIGETALDEVRIYRKALNEKEIAALYAEEAKTYAAARRSPAGAEQLPLCLSKKPLYIQVGDSRLFQLKGVNVFAGPVCLDLWARIDRRACSQYYGLELRVNGKRVSPYLGNSRCFTRLLNKPFFYTYTAGGEGCWFGENWVVYYGLDWDDALAIKTASADKPKDLHRYVFDLTDLLRPDETNTLEIRNVAYTVRNATHGTDCPMAVKDPLLRRLTPEEQNPAPAYSYPPAGVVVPNPYDNTDYDCAVLGNGSLKIACGGAEYLVESVYSYPGGIGNGFHAADGLQPEAGWKVSTNQDRTSVVGQGKFYKVERTIARHPNHIAITDRITNTSNEDLGMVIRNDVRFGAEAKDVYVCGNRNITFKGQLSSDEPGDREQATQEAEATFSSYNPTFFVRAGSGGLGIAVLDDVVRIQSKVVADRGRGGVHTDRFALASGKSYDLTWKIVPVADGGYYDFINVIRKEEGINVFPVDSCAVGAWYMSRWEDPRLKKWLDDRKLKYLIVSATVPGMDSKTRHGPAFLDHADKVVPEYRQLVKKVHEARPGTKVLIYFSTLHFVDEKDYIKLAQGSLKMRPNGKPVRYGRDYFCVHVAGRDPFSDELRKYIDFCLDTIGLDGIFWDVMACERERDIDYSRWDGHSAILDENYRIKQKISIQGIEGIPFFVELIERIYAKDKVLVVDYFSGAKTVFDVLKKHRVLGIMEGNNLGRCLVRTHLHTPLTMRGAEDPTDRGRGFLQIVQNIRNNLRHANLYAFYGAWTDLMHSISADHLYPITPVELHEGYIIGRNKIVTTRPGSYGWRTSEAADLRVAIYNEKGEKIPCRSEPREENGCRLIALDLAPDQIAIVERVAPER